MRLKQNLRQAEVNLSVFPEIWYTGCMTQIEQQKAAKNFSEFWAGKGDEKQESQRFLSSTRNWFRNRSAVIY